MSPTRRPAPRVQSNPRSQESERLVHSAFVGIVGIEQRDPRNSLKIFDVARLDGESDVLETRALLVFAQRKELEVAEEDVRQYPDLGNRRHAYISPQRHGIGS